MKNFFLGFLLGLMLSITLSLLAYKMGVKVTQDEIERVTIQNEN